MRVCRPFGANTGTIEVVRSTERPAGTYRKKPGRGSQRLPLAPTVARRSVGALTRIARETSRRAPLPGACFSPPSVQRHLSQQSTSLTPRITPSSFCSRPRFFHRTSPRLTLFVHVPAPSQHATHCPPTPFSFLLPSPALFTGRVCVRLSLTLSHEACAPQHAAPCALHLFFRFLEVHTGTFIPHPALPAPRHLG